jgi:hypothetical protein
MNTDFLRIMVAQRTNENAWSWELCEMRAAIYAYRRVCDEIVLFLSVHRPIDVSDTSPYLVEATLRYGMFLASGLTRLVEWGCSQGSWLG